MTHEAADEAEGVPASCKQNSAAEQHGESAVAIPAAMASDQQYMKGYSMTRMADMIQAELKRTAKPPAAAPGKLYKAVWTGGPKSWEWAVRSGSLSKGCQSILRPSLAEAKDKLNGKWLHIAGDSTSRQLFNSLVSWLAPKANYRAVRKNDMCYLAFSKTRAMLSQESPINRTAMEENHLNMCRCRKGLLFWDTARDGYFTRQKDGFDFRLTYSYKELMYEDSDVGAMDGEWPEIKSGQPTGKNLYQAFKEGLPDMWIGNAGAHAFHLRPGMGLSAPDDAAVLDYARNLSRYTQLMQTRYLGRKPNGCMLWKANNVPPPHACPPQHFLHINRVTTPAMLKAGVHVIDPEDIGRYNRMKLSCDIHLQGTSQQNIAWLAVTALASACT
uniref:Uncharacterized protein n=1 Tax=Eutreptiella gymnastica TaxID=73025 RepID=A0A7S4GJE5_9EUGL